MRRKLSDKIDWSPEIREIELLDWRNSSEDFDRLCQYVIGELNTWLVARNMRKADQVLAMDWLRSQIRCTAEAFEERHKSLALFIVLWMKQVIAQEIQRRKNVWKAS